MYWCLIWLWRFDLLLIGLSSSIYTNHFLSVWFIAALPSLKNLHKLDLSSSTLDDSLLQTIGRIATLKSLKLNGCRLSGNITIAQGKSDGPFWSLFLLSPSLCVCVCVFIQNHNMHIYKFSLSSFVCFLFMLLGN